MKLIIATRKSQLAQCQTDIVIDLLKDKSNMESEKLLVVTEGDRRLDVTLDKIGGKGVFTKEIEEALLDGRADAAVHSMKDVPFELFHKFEIVAIPEREDVRDVLISNDNRTLKELKYGATIGTSSIRRAEQLRIIRNDLNIVPIRGNVQTRLRKMKEEKMDGIILAAAGIKRLGLDTIVSEYFDPKEFLPAIGQGALGIEALKNHYAKEYLQKLDSLESRLTVDAERAFMKTLNGGCHTLIGAYSEVSNNDLYMVGRFLKDGKIIKKDIVGDKSNNIQLGIELASKILRA